MVLPDSAATQTFEVKTQQVKLESTPRGSFQRILHKQIKQGQQTKAPSAEGSKPDANYADTQVQPAKQDAGSILSDGEHAAGVLPIPGPAPEAASPSAESASAILPESGSVAESTEGLTTTAATKSSPTGLPGQESMTPAQGQEPALWDSQEQVSPAHKPASVKTVQTNTPASASSNRSTPLTADKQAGVQYNANHPGQTAASAANQGTGSAGQGANSEDIQSTPLLSMAGKVREVPNAKEPQGKTDNQGQQTIRELAEWESRKLTRQKIHVIQPSSAAEHSEVGRESRSDYTYQAVRPEGLIPKSPEQNSLVTDKTTGFNSNLNSQDVLNQIVRKAELMVKSNNSQMKIELYPEFLGKLTIKVMVEEGAVTAKFITDNHQVKQMLEANLGMLRQSLESQGMRVERAEVDVQLNNGGLFDGSHGQREWNWENRFFHYHGESGLTDQDAYQNAQELLPAEPVSYETYGIGPDGGLNFVI